MIDLTTDIRHERAVLIGVATPDTPFEKMNEYLTELAFLVDTAGGLLLEKSFKISPILTHVPT